MIETFGKPMGLGRTSDVYSYKKSSVVKLLKPSFPEELLNYEAKIHTAVQSLGLPIPKLLDKVNIDGRPGLVYEKIHGITMAEAILGRPRDILKYALDMAALHADIGSCKANESLPKIKERLYQGITHQIILDGKEATLIKNMLKTLGSGYALCHSDFHPYNIMTAGNKYWIIDWTNSASGCFVADIMRTLMILSYATDPNGQISSFLARTAGFLIKKTYIKRILALSGQNAEEIFSWEIPTIAARFSEDVPPGEEKALRIRIDKLLN